MVRTGQDAIDYARSRQGSNVVPAGYCLAVTREFYAIGSYYGSAIDAWNGAQWRHEDSSPPPATPVFFASSSVYDHVAFYVSHDEVITVFNEDIRALTWNDMLATFGPRYGWTEDLNTVRVYEGEDDMPSADEVAVAVWNHSLAHGGIGPAPAYVFLADSLRYTMAGNEAVGAVPAKVWGEVRVLNGAGPAEMAVFVGDARNYAIGAKDAAQEAAANTSDLNATGSVPWQTVLALVLAVAVVIGLLFAVLYSTREGVMSGAAVLLGGIIGWVATTLRIGSRGRHA